MASPLKTNERTIAMNFPGGGIRSASFTMGILRAMAGLPPPDKPAQADYPRYEEFVPKFDKLNQFEKQYALNFLSQLDFLSCNSGGGYTASSFVTFQRYFRDNFTEARELAYEKSDFYSQMDNVLKDKDGITALKNTTEEAAASPTLERFSSRDTQYASNMINTAAVYKLSEKMKQSCGYVINRDSGWLRWFYDFMSFLIVFGVAEICTLIPLLSSVFLGANVAVALFGNLIAEAYGAAPVYGRSGFSNSTLSESSNSTSSTSDSLIFRAREAFSVVSELYMYSALAMIVLGAAAFTISTFRKKLKLNHLRQLLKCMELFFVLLVVPIAVYCALIPIVLLLQNNSLTILALLGFLSFLVIVVYSLYNGLNATALIMSIASMGCSFSVLFGMAEIVRRQVFEKENQEMWTILKYANLALIVAFAFWGRLFRSLLSEYYSRCLEMAFYCPLKNQKRQIVVNIIRSINKLVPWIHIEVPEFRYIGFRNPLPFYSDFKAGKLQESTGIETLLLLNPKPTLVINAVVHDLYPIKKDPAKMHLIGERPDPKKSNNEPGVNQPTYGHFLMSTGWIDDGTQELKEADHSLDFTYFGGPDRLSRLARPTINLAQAMAVSAAAVSIGNGKVEDQARSRQLISLLFAGGLGGWVKYPGDKPIEISYPPKFKRQVKGQVEYTTAATYKLKIYLLFLIHGMLSSGFEILVACILSLVGYCISYEGDTCSQYLFDFLFQDTWTGKSPPNILIATLVAFAFYMAAAFVPSGLFNIGSHSSFVRSLFQIFKIVYEGPTNVSPGAFVYVSDGAHWENLGVFQLFRQKSDVILMVDSSLDRFGLCADFKNALDIARAELGCSFTPSDEDQAAGVYDLDKALRDFTFSTQEEKPFLKFKVYYPLDDERETFKVGTVYYIKAFRYDVRNSPAALRNKTLSRETPKVRPGFLKRIVRAIADKTVGIFPMHVTPWQFFNRDDHLAYCGLGYNYIIPVIRDMIKTHAWIPDGHAGSSMFDLRDDSANKQESAAPVNTVRSTAVIDDAVEPIEGNITGNTE